MPWDLLGILAIVCAVLCAVGFYKFVYSKATEDIVDDLHEVPSWDLSPSWG